VALRDRIVALRDRFTLVEWGIAVFAAAILGKAAWVQLVQGEQWRRIAERQQVRVEELPAPRGRIHDAAGLPLAESQALVTLSVAPREIACPKPKPGVRPTCPQRDSLAKRLARLGVARADVRKALDTTRRWVNLRGRFPLADAGPILGMRGVHPDYDMARITLASRGVRAVVGAVAGGRGASGLELTLDSVLTGTSGIREIIRTGRGDKLGSPDAPVTAAVPGNAVTLTIDYALQDIAERALGQAIDENGAEGGDVVVLDPMKGEVLALASRGATGVAPKLTAVTDVYEPGSTIKPFIVGKLRAGGRVRFDEWVNTHNGRWNYNGRPLEDAHKAARMTVAEVLQQSSNIGIVQLRDRLGDRAHYELLRDLGFGAFTGVGYPSESPGLLRPPTAWSRQTGASLAIGYELLVTPLQMALAYATIANGGLLLEPSLVREIRSHDSTRVVWRHTPRVVRRVFSESAAKELRDVLVGTVEAGTARDAGVSRYRIAGKTGTARRARNGAYVPNEYVSSFVGIFPADDPQLVVLVKIDRPTKQIFGGKVAAPVLKAIVEGTISSRTVAIDRGRLSQVRLAQRPPAESVVVAERLAAAQPSAKRVRPPIADAGDGLAPVMVSLVAPPTEATVRVGGTRAVPSVAGLPLRDAVYALHRAGFRVMIDSLAPDGTTPGTGATAPAGTLVRLHRAP
jgi:cell division protein FtsI (penicillin-binding protein 3)